MAPRRIRESCYKELAAYRLTVIRTRAMSTES